MIHIMIHCSIVLNYKMNLYFLYHLFLLYTCLKHVKAEEPLTPCSPGEYHRSDGLCVQCIKNCNRDLDEEQRKVCQPYCQTTTNYIETTKIFQSTSQPSKGSDFPGTYITLICFSILFTILVILCILFFCLNEGRWNSSRRPREPQPSLTFTVNEQRNSGEITIGENNEDGLPLLEETVNAAAPNLISDQQTDINSKIQ